MPSDKTALSILKNILESITKTNRHISSNLQHRIKHLQQSLLWCFEDTQSSWRLQRAMAIPGLNGPSCSSASTLISLLYSCNPALIFLIRYIPQHCTHTARVLTRSAVRDYSSSRFDRRDGNAFAIRLGSEPWAVLYPQWFFPPRCQRPRHY